MYTFQTQLSLTVEQAIPVVLEQLKKEGFGVLMDLDIQATMKQKIGADIPAYHILGACNPQLAHQALMSEPEVGALLPWMAIHARYKRFMKFLGNPISGLLETEVQK